MAATGETAAVNRTERFFRWVWRVNGLLLLAALAGAAIGLLTLVLNESHGTPRKSTATADAPAGALHLGVFEPVEGTTLFTASLLDGYQSYSGSGSGGDEPASRNTLIYDAADGSKHWLLPDHTATLCNIDQLSKSDSSSAPPLAWTWTARDSQGRYHISMADQAGRQAQVLLDADDCYDHAYAQDGHAVIFFSQQGRPVVSVVDIATRQVLRTDALPEPQAN
ncbi:MAG TPA: hypothetical protein VFG49_04955 [Dyella sp.]|uniref:hypothetical protein n=1 Tax=Dyella sp. TaxID=1869338 RepID=UPI002D766756|nr:hypothetical protein [Dyella sp.]HET6552869.1 hypothetical protein [Dyella sp.]